MPNWLAVLLRHRYSFSILFLLCCIAVQAQAGTGTFSVVGQSRWVQVAAVFDGDTFRTRSGEKVRLLGINTPEIAHGNQAGQAYGVEAKRALRALILYKTVQLRMDKDKRDMYGRTLAQVYLRNGAWINDVMVREGMAHVYTFAPNFYWASALLRTEAKARLDMRGLWKSTRWRVMDAKQVSKRHIGEFHVLRGIVHAAERWRFRLGKITVSVPRKAHQWFAVSDMPKQGQWITLGGVVRMSSSGNLYLSLYSPYDLRR